MRVIERFATSATVKHGRESPDTPQRVADALQELQTENRHDHRPFLVEYGLRLHVQFLQQSGLSRELSISENPLNAALVSELHMEMFATDHEGGWLKRQFYGEFTWRSYSSYQVYVWVLEANEITFDWPNAERIQHLMKSIQQTGIHGLGGNGECHCGCQRR